MTEPRPGPDPESTAEPVPEPREPDVDGPADGAVPAPPEPGARPADAGPAGAEPAADSAGDHEGSGALSESDRAYVMASLTRVSGDYAEISARLRVAEDRLEDLAVGLDDIEDTAAAASAMSAADGQPAAGQPADADVALDADSETDEDGAGGESEAADRDGIDMVELVAWVRDHVALLLERKLPLTGTPPHWCRQWWMHAEAIARFEALRRGWLEAVVGGGNAMVVWFEHLDAMLAVLMGEGGPFSSCEGGVHRAAAVQMLGHDEPDAVYFAEFDLLDTGRPTSEASITEPATGRPT